MKEPADPIIKQFYGELTEAHKLAQSRRQLLEPSMPAYDDPTFDDWKKQMTAISRSCAAAVSAAVKRAKRSFVFKRLEALQSDGADLTITNVEHIAREILGRGFDNRAVAEVFGTPGRTAADKSDWSPDRDEVVVNVQVGLRKFLKVLDTYKHLLRIRYNSY